VQTVNPSATENTPKKETAPVVAAKEAVKTEKPQEKTPAPEVTKTPSPNTDNT